MAVGVRFYTGNLGNRPNLQRMTVHIKVVTGLQAKHARPAVVAVLVFVHGHRRFHIVQEEFAIHTHRIKQAVIQVKSKRTVVYVFRIIAFFNKERHQRYKKPGLVFVVQHLQFAHAHSQVTQGKFVTVRIQIAVVQVVHAIAPTVHAQVGIHAKHAERAKRKVQVEHVVGQRKLVEREIIIIARPPVQNITGKRDSRPGVVQPQVRTVTGVAHVVGTGITIFGLNIEHLAVKALGLFGRMLFGINAGI